MGRRGRGAVLVCPPADGVALAVELLDPHRAERIHRGHRAQPGRRRGGVDGGEQGVAVPRDGLGQGQVFLLAGGEVVGIDPWPVARDPGGLGDAAQPVGRDDGQAVEGVAQCLACALKAVERPDGPEHAVGFGSYWASFGSFDGCALSVPPAPVQAQNSVVSNRSRIRSGSFPTIA